MPTLAPAPAPMAPAMAAPLAASFLLLPQPLIVPSSSLPVLAHGFPPTSSSEPVSEYFASSGVTTLSSTMRISARPLMRFEGLMKATWPSTRLPSGIIVLLLAVTACWTTPVNLSPVLLVLEVSVVVSRTWSMVPAGKVTPFSAARAQAGATAATRRLATSAFIAVLISPSPSVLTAGPHGPTLPPPRGYSSRHYFHCTRRSAGLQVILGGFDSGGLVGVVPRPRKIPPDLERTPSRRLRLTLSRPNAQHGAH